jgi:hypothetical protein
MQRKATKAIKTKERQPMQKARIHAANAKPGLVPGKRHRAANAKPGVLPGNSTRTTADS